MIAYEAVAEFRAAMLDAGLSPPEHIVPSKWHRFSTNGKASDDAGWCRLFDDGQGGIYGDYRTGLSGTWQAKRDTPYTPEEREAFRRKCGTARRKREVEGARRHAAAAKKAKRLWQAAPPARADHPYLARKRVAPTESLREVSSGEIKRLIGYTPSAKGETLEGRLLIAAITIGDMLASVELIDEAGRKHFLYDGAQKAGYWAAQPLPDGEGAGITLCIGEGVATVLSVREATGYPVLAAMSSGNLGPVAKAMRQHYPKARIVLLADVGNGQAEAEAAAKAIEGGCVVPAIDPAQGKDFNDVAVNWGLEVVKECVEKVVREQTVHELLNRTFSSSDNSPTKERKAGEETHKIRAAIARLAEDAGAVLTEEAREAWIALYREDQAEFERLRKAAKQAGARVTEINKLVGTRSKFVRSKFGQKEYTSQPSHPSHTRVSDLPQTSQIPPPLGGIAPGALVYTDDRGDHRLVESAAAEVVARALTGQLAWDTEAQSWLRWRGSHWEPLTGAAPAEKLLADAVHVGTAHLGFRPSYLEGIVKILCRRSLLPPPEPPAETVPFQNGLLHLKTRELIPATPERAHYWCLPHEYSPEADCPTIRAWLLQSVDGDAETVELLRAWMAALLRGVPLQKLLLLIGPGGTGKGTFQRLVTEFIGGRNVAVTKLRDLEDNRFETAKLYGARLAMLNEAGRYGGSINMLKSITGGDQIPLERKHVQQTGSFAFTGLVLMVSNDQLATTDVTSGLERRRLTVEFRRRATPAEKAKWEHQGGEAAVLHREIPGLINWLLELSEADIRARIEEPPKSVKAANLLGMAAGNSVADWLMESCVPEPGGWTQIGHKVELRNPSNGLIHYEKADTRLYPHYLTWCRRTGRDKPLALKRFRDTVVDMAETLGHAVTGGLQPGTKKAGITGLRLRGDNEPEHDWLGDPSQREVSGRDRGRDNSIAVQGRGRDGRDQAENSSPENFPHQLGSDDGPDIPGPSKQNIAASTASRAEPPSWKGQSVRHRKTGAMARVESDTGGDWVQIRYVPEGVLTRVRRYEVEPLIAEGEVV